MKRLSLGMLTAAIAFAGESGTGIRPRPAATDYPARETAHGITMAAAVIPPEQVAKLFATDLNKGGYLIVEVAFFPESGSAAAIATRDFLLRVGSDPATLRPVSAGTIAAAVHRVKVPKPRNPGDVNVYPSATIGYESGGSYDPVTGRRRNNGVYTGAGVGVGIGDSGQAPPPASTDRDRSTMEQELSDKALPEKKVSEAVAGYLYFPKPQHMKKNSGFSLTYYGAEGQMHLVIPPPAK